MTGIDEAYQALFEGDFAKVAVLEAEMAEDSFERLNLRMYLAVEQKDFHKAEAAMVRYLEKARDLGNLEQEQIGLHQMAYVKREEGDLEVALDWIKEEAHFLQEAFPKDHYRQSINLYEQGYLRLKLGFAELGRPYMVQALAYALESTDLINQACAYRGLGEIDQALSDTSQAILHLTESLKLFEQAGDQVAVSQVKELMVALQSLR